MNTKLTQKDVIDFIKANKEFLKKRYHITEIGIFGSFVNNTQTDKSDIDLLVEFEKDTQNLWNLKEELKDLFYQEFHRKTDIVRAKFLKPYAKDKILKETIYVS